MPDVDCLTSLLPCSHTVTGNLLLMILYGVILAGGAKLIADGSELLLEISNPTIIGGLVLPILGAIPDAAIILASGLGPDAQEQLSVGVGTLAGSTIMLLTVPWLGGLILGRCDLRDGEAEEGVCNGFSWTQQGVTVDSDVPSSAKIMMLTAISYFVVQGPGWAGHESAQRPAALATLIMGAVFLVFYCVYQVYSSMANAASERKFRKHQDAIKANAQVNALVAIYAMKGLASKKEGIRTPLLGSTNAPSDEDVEARQEQVAIKFGAKWRSKTLKGSREEMEEPQAADSDDKKEDEEERPSWKIALESISTMLFGLALVSVFSDPMCDVLSALTDTRFTGSNGSHIPVAPFYVSFIVTPICSNASELISSLMFAAKKKKENISLTYSQLYGAGTMNNTLCLAVFCALVYLKNLDWNFTAEVTVIILVEVLVGIVGLKKTLKMWYGIPVACLYFISLALVALLENVVGLD